MRPRPRRVSKPEFLGRLLMNVSKSVSLDIRLTADDSLNRTVDRDRDMGGDADGYRGGWGAGPTSPAPGETPKPEGNRRSKQLKWLRSRRGRTFRHSSEARGPISIICTLLCKLKVSLAFTRKKTGFRSLKFFLFNWQLKFYLIDNWRGTLIYYLTIWI